MATNNAVNEATAASGKILQGQGVGTASAFSTATYPATATGTGKILRADGTNWSATTATYPDTAGTTGNVLTSDGTNWASSAAPASGIPTIGTSTNTGIVTWNGTTGSAVLNNATATIDSTGRYVNTAQPAGKVYLSANVTSVTGDGTTYKVAFNTAQTDQGSNFNTSTNTFTAPVSGHYIFTTNLCIYNLSVAQTSCIGIINNSNGAQEFCRQNPFTNAIGADLTICGSYITFMSATNTCTVTLTIANGTKTASVAGGAGSQASYFSWALLC